MRRQRQQWMESVCCTRRSAQRHARAATSTLHWTVRVRTTVRAPLLTRESTCRSLSGRLQVLNPKAQNMTYDISDLYAYVDQLADISLLMCAERCGVFFRRPRARSPVSLSPLLHSLCAMPDLVTRTTFKREHS